MEHNDLRKGCNECRKIVYSSGNLPLIEDDVSCQISLHKCSICNSYWLYSERFAKVLEIEELKDYFPTEYEIVKNKSKDL